MSEEIEYVKVLEEEVVKLDLSNNLNGAVVVLSEDRCNCQYIFAVKFQLNGKLHQSDWVRIEERDVTNAMWSGGIQAALELFKRELVMAVSDLLFPELKKLLKC